MPCLPTSLSPAPLHPSAIIVAPLPQPSNHVACEQEQWSSHPPERRPNPHVARPGPVVVFAPHLESCESATRIGSSRGRPIADEKHIQSCKLSAYANAHAVGVATTVFLDSIFKRDHRIDHARPVIDAATAPDDSTILRVSITLHPSRDSTAPCHDDSTTPTQQKHTSPPQHHRHPLSTPKTIPPTARTALDAAIVRSGRPESGVSPGAAQTNVAAGTMPSTRIRRTDAAIVRRDCSQDRFSPAATPPSGTNAAAGTMPSTRMRRTCAAIVRHDCSQGRFSPAATSRRWGLDDESRDLPK
ncbi:hypothetical protein QYE76_026804 [Lolium multiflorum]|uniref:Uncharacterized protein n=1 Tax=Lolium multiflorum TaxID=4521 RepID=A0AAD8VVK4_LOLMU|nr:hypothetical protein QYE76_026804 [Lolium multiflorum]